MYALKFAHLVKERTEADVYQFYIDMRSFGKGYEEFYLRVLREGTTAIRGKVAEVVPSRNGPGGDGFLLVRVEDTLIGKFREIPVDMVVLCNAIEPQADADEVGRIFSLNRSPDGFFMERHPKLDPVGTTTDGVFVAGCSQGPKDIPDTVAQAQAAAANILASIALAEVVIEPIRAVVDETLCGACKTCIGLCPYTAISFHEDSNVAVVNEALCKGCGTCVAACPASAATGPLRIRRIRAPRWSRRWRRSSTRTIPKRSTASSTASSIRLARSTGSRWQRRPWDVFASTTDMTHRRPWRREHEAHPDRPDHPARRPWEDRHLPR
jgi:heterodisulfide reductase subunit A